MQTPGWTVPTVLKVREPLAGSARASKVLASFPSPNSRAQPPLLTGKGRGKLTVNHGKQALVQVQSHWEEE